MAERLNAEVLNTSNRFRAIHWFESSFPRWQHILQPYRSNSFMAIGPEQRAYMMSALKKAIAKFYGDRVPTLDAFRNKRRKTFMEKLELAVDAAGWRQKLSDQRVLRGTAQGVVTRLDNERSARQIELRAKHEQEVADLRAKQQLESTKLIQHYEPAMLDAKEKLNAQETAISAMERESYFAGLGIEDDNRQFYRGSVTVDNAITERVDAFIENNLVEDEEGSAVLKRMEQEQLISDSTYIAGNMADLRKLVLEFINNKKLPNITVEAWLIENGVDLMVKQ
jgi:hypothetical protein